MFGFLTFVFLLGLGLVAGRAAERRHYGSIHQREKSLLHVPAVSTKTLPDGVEVRATSLAVGSVVVSVDYFKQFIAGLRMLFGGEIETYAPLLDRARREALLRMKESCPSADLFLNTRLETSSVGGEGGRGGLGAVEVMAYATAVYFRKDGAA